MEHSERQKISGFRLVIAGGGTGGHLFPGIAVARALKTRMGDAEVLFVVGRRPMERDILSRSGFEAVSIDVEGIKGRGWKKGIPVLFRLPKSILQSASIIRRFSPSVALGVGGYSAGPFCTAAKWMGIPTAIHEQNSYPGVTNRLLSRIVDRIFISFEESRSCFSKREVILTGNPVRQELVLSRPIRPEGEQEFTVLVVGGSQGAQAINRIFVEALDGLREKGKKIAVIHQTGTIDYERVVKDYRTRGLEGEISMFIADMATAYSRADMVVSRAGASTIFELAALGKPSILIPYPYATNRHQEINASALVRKGGAEMMLQEELTAEGLANALTRYMDNRPALQEMGERARQIGSHDAAGEIVDRLMEMSKVTKVSESD
ncbi:MAG: UDP-N-acetylglucosamine--N-acetylmuramyl-(pentapeptide) pyrophosphoryl-undecaprenol [Thermodesulfobacteriota bacterium]|nr:UDP-N-acetylglucosamine--N-acetylmuramyl-(pentapeptide) pyrophosphoryl-undecaprenol [Thermodesulfobacteriota bacterium]